VIEELLAEVRASQAATDAVDRAAAEKLGINRTDASVFDVIDQAPDGRMTAGELAEKLGMSSAAVTTVVDRLERKGYARRVRDDVDRRRVFVELDPGAREMGRRLYAPLAKAGMKIIERYSTEELAMMRDFMRAARELSEEHARRLRGQPR
jgi:DNA-binding MarR family transcriptional regulator